MNEIQIRQIQHSVGDLLGELQKTELGQAGFSSKVCTRVLVRRTAESEERVEVAFGREIRDVRWMIVKMEHHRLAPLEMRLA